MKKLMMMTAVAICACAVQASSVTWSVTGLKTATAGTGAFTASSDSLALVYGFVGTSSDLAAATAAAAGGAAAWSTWLSAQPSALGTTHGAGVEGTLSSGTGSTVLKSSQGTFDGSTVQSVYLIIFDSSTPNFYMASTLYTQTLGGSGAKAYTFGTPGSSAMLPTVWTPIPEPATMALMALGVGVIALRRKFRK